VADGGTLCQIIFELLNRAEATLGYDNCSTKAAVPSSTGLDRMIQAGVADLTTCLGWLVAL
jgi:hypothetical protein